MIPEFLGPLALGLLVGGVAVLVAVYFCVEIVIRPDGKSIAGMQIRKGLAKPYDGGLDKMLNPGFTAIVKDEDFAIEAGPYIYCPKCKKPLMEAVVDKFKTRCKHCKRWVYLERKSLTNKEVNVK